jgi:hypothetical protein
MTIDELIEQYYDDLDGAITGFSGGSDTLDITFEYDESFQGEARIATIRCTMYASARCIQGASQSLLALQITRFYGSTSSRTRFSHSVRRRRTRSSYSVASIPRMSSFLTVGELHEITFTPRRRYFPVDTVSSRRAQTMRFTLIARLLSRSFSVPLSRSSRLKSHVSLFCLMKRLSSVAMSHCSIHPKRPNQVQPTAGRSDV